MLKEYTCIICPIGCDITVQIKDKEILSLNGANCKRGHEYVKQEIINPQRNIATSILVDGGELPLVSVRLSKPVPKEKIFSIMEIIKNTRVKAPVKIGQVVIPNVLNTGSDVIITKNLDSK